MNPRNGARRFLETALMLWGMIPLALGCGDAASVSQVSPTSIQASRPEAEVKTPKELWVTSQGENVIFIRNFEDLSAVDQITSPSGGGPHIITFHSPDFAYVGGMTDGNVYVIDANARQVVQGLQVAPTLPHQVKVSPDGATALVSIISTKRVTKLFVDEANRSWSLAPVSTSACGPARPRCAPCSGPTANAPSSRSIPAASRSWTCPP